MKQKTLRNWKQIKKTLVRTKTKLEEKNLLTVEYNITWSKQCIITTKTKKIWDEMMMQLIFFKRKEKNSKNNKQSKSKNITSLSF